MELISHFVFIGNIIVNISVSISLWLSIIIITLDNLIQYGFVITVDDADGDSPPPPF